MVDDASPLQIAVWQAASVPRDIDANLRALSTAAQDAAARGADLLITPEMYVTGYDIPEDVARLASERPLERVRAIAAHHRIAILAGGPELIAGPDGTTGVANAAWFIDEGGEIRSRHRKVQLFGDLDRSMFVAGQDPCTLVTYRGTRIATLICFDVEFPEAVRAAAQAGADLVAVPTAQMEPFGFVNAHVIRVRAWENGVYVAYANQCGEEGGLTYVGRSVVASPFGEHLAEAARDGEAVLLADIDPVQLAAARAQNTYLTDVRTSLYRADT